MKKRVADLIEATTPVRKKTGHLKLIAAWKFIAAIGTIDLSYSKPKEADIPNISEFKAAMKPFLADLMNGKLQIDSFVKEIS